MEEYIIFVCLFWFFFLGSRPYLFGFPVGVVSCLFGCLIPNLKALKSWIDGVLVAF